SVQLAGYAFEPCHILCFASVYREAGAFVASPSSTPAGEGPVGGRLRLHHLSIIAGAIQDCALPSIPGAVELEIAIHIAPCASRVEARRGEARAQAMHLRAGPDLT